PDLKVWHTADLDAEYTARSDVKSFKEYLELEDRLFTQLDELVYAKVKHEDQRKINRYFRGSLTNPGRWKKNWNRSYGLSTVKPKFGVLLIHGMSDSPYSLHSLATRLHQEGGWVVGLRVPGHGTAPAGLVNVKWQDMAAAVKLALQHLNKQTNGAPLYIVGYSNGGALAVQYALSSLDDKNLPALNGVVLMSPEIGLTKLAALAVWQERLGHLFGLEKLSWNSILPEYDPYKYGSFALNAGKQAYLLTLEIQDQITRLDASSMLQNMPRILAFQSVVDATVTAPALVNGLFNRLPDGAHELFLYDINRYSGIEPVLNSNPSAWINDVLQNTGLGYTVTLLTNKNEDSSQVVTRSRLPRSKAIIECPLDMKWPREIYSLSHVALPFQPSDPVYGRTKAVDAPGLPLGRLALRGERGVLQIAAADLMRLRWNPFYTYQEARILDFLGLAAVVPGHNCTP
ncbi:MAG TPA: alpha/beta fold hydrolase, partial [Gammaproteobacteria bacterium]|nr:alpha/beta fold hydrolase [Gammaproteobacteria bacterium]